MEQTIQVDKYLMHQLIKKIDTLSDHVKALESESKTQKKYLNAKEVMEIAGVSYAWLKMNKHQLGCTKIAGKLKFPRKGIEEYMNENYFKTKAIR